MADYPDFSAYNYRIVRELARNREGGRISYLAEDIARDCTLEAANHRLVVIKQFRFLQHDSSWQGFKAYEREIQILQSLNHPRIPQYLESFETIEGFCMVQEYKDAPNLAAKSHLIPEEVKEIAVSVLEILVYLQSFIPPIIHRDIKPENILVDSENKAYLIDFGLSKIGGTELAISSVVAGTPGFMPPEELLNRSLTKAADLYSLGATLIGLLTNRKSTEISNLIDESYRFNFQDALPELNHKFVAWLTKMVEPSLKERFQDAKTALNALETIATIDKTSEELSNRPQGFARSDRQYFAIPYRYLTGIRTIFLLAVIGTFIGNVPLKKFLNTDVKNYVVRTTSVSTGAEWFEQIKPHCNALEVTTTIKSYPPPNTTEGSAYAASCYALAGKIKQAEALIEKLPSGDRPYAAGVLFNIGHPIADAGDDESAGPIMRLVLKYWTQNYMAMYHAGMSEYAVGDLKLSQQHLAEFLVTYKNEDVWRQKAKLVLERIDKNLKIDSEPKINPAALSGH